MKEQAKPTVPKPVTVEDEPESSASAEAPVSLDEPPKEIVDAAGENSSAPAPATDAPAPTPVPDITPPETTLPVRISPISRTYDAALLSDAARLCGESQARGQELESRFANLMDQTSMSHYAPLAFSSDSQQFPFCPPRPSPFRGPIMGPGGTTFSVACNSCEKNIPNIHYHCSTCDDGDFDLCPSCVDQGITCHGRDHWLIKRSTVDGQLVQSTTETIAPKPKPKPEVKVETVIETKIEPQPQQLPLPKSLFEPIPPPFAPLGIMRTCNCCMQGTSLKIRCQ